jgi:hypothetical protein
LDPQGLLEGKGQYVRHIKVRNPSDIDEDVFVPPLAAGGAVKQTSSNFMARMVGLNC